MASMVMTCNFDPPNQSLEPMARASTPRAWHESRRLSPWLTIKR